MFNYLSLLITFANSLDPDQAGHDVQPELDPNCLTLLSSLYKNFWKKLILKKNQQMTKKLEKNSEGAKSLRVLLHVCKKNQ